MPLNVRVEARKFVISSNKWDGLGNGGSKEVNRNQLALVSIQIKENKTETPFGVLPCVSRQNHC